MRFLGLDLGQRRVGVAISDPTGTIAGPLATLPADVELAGAVRRLALEHQVDAVVVGIPHRLDGSTGPAAESAGEFARSLAGMGITVHTWDERLTTREAERLLIQGDVSRKRRRQTVDRMAATLILQSFLDHWNRTKPDSER
ncbi:MAG: Holliday junction resolvase RuvX [Bacillota bacterium]